MFCPLCGRRNIENARFCQGCGANFSDIASKIKNQQNATSQCLIQFAGFWRRCVAVFIDGIILAAAGANIGGIFGFTDGAYWGAVDGFKFIGDFNMSMGNVNMRNIISLLIIWVYYASMESSPLQATLGKMVIGIKVTDLNFGRITFARATGRHFGKIVSSVTLFIGFIMAGFTEKKQALHDKIAGCLVVKKGKGIIISEEIGKY